jgi:hypothetical protein
MSEIGGTSPSRRGSQDANGPISNERDTMLPSLPRETFRREASAPLPMDSSAAGILSLPIVHTAVATGKGTTKPVFSPHSLLLTNHGVLLTSHVTQEEIALPLSVIFDIFPVLQKQDSESLFLAAPTPNLLQILTSSKRLVGLSPASDGAELTVTLAMPSMQDCTALVMRLADARRGPDTATNGGTPKSLFASSPSSHMHSGSPASPIQSTAPPSPLVVPEERRVATATSEREKSAGLPQEFTGLCFQVVGDAKGCTGVSLGDINGYRLCNLRLQAPGLVIEQPATPGRWQGPFSVPWAALIEVRIADPTFDVDQPPATHPQVVRLTVAHRVGLTGSSSCRLNVAVDSPVRTQALLRAFKAHQQQHQSVRPLQPPGSMSSTPGAALTNAAGMLGQRVEGAEINAGPPNNRVQVSSLGAPPGGAKDGEPLHVVHINNTPVQLTPAMANLLMSYKPEDSRQPNNFQVDKAFILLPTVQKFQRCSLLIDKLGLAVTPLVATDKLQERGKSGARAVRDAGGVVCDYALTTEALHFPISALVDVTEEAELKLSNMPKLPPELSPSVPAAHAPSASASQTQPSSSSTASGGVTTTAAPASGSTSSTGSRRQLLPFTRLVAPWEKPAESEQGGEKIEKGKVPEPPFPHLVGVRAKAALAGRLHGVEKTPIHLRINAQPPPPVAMVFCFTDRDAAVGFISTILSFKKYHLSVALSTYLNTLTAVSQRQSERRGNRQTEEGVVAQRMQGQASTPSVEPPPLPPRPADLPQANRLPRMVTNDEGEVFWYIPRKQAPKPTGVPVPPATAAQQTGAARPMPVPQPDSDLGNPPPPDPSPRDGQQAASSQPQGVGDFLGSLDGGPVLQTPPRSSGSQSSAAAGPGPGSSQQSGASMAPQSPPAKKLPSVPLMQPFDDDLGVVDTPAPCLASPTPAPGRRSL